MKTVISFLLVVFLSRLIAAQIADPAASPQPAKTPIPTNKYDIENLSADRDKYGKVIIIKTESGDSAYSITDGYGISLTELERFNKLKLGDEFKSGTEIKIPVTDEVFSKLVRNDHIIIDSGKFFKQGLLNMQDNRRSQAGNDFDKSVEVFLASGVNVSHNKKLQSCYSQLIETIYRMEFPSNTQQPSIRSLSATCGWAIDNDLADKVTKFVLNAPTKTDNSAATTSGGGQTSSRQDGFNEQKFEASPLDELAKLELTPEEEQVQKKIYPRINVRGSQANLAILLGEKPIQAKDGKVQAVMTFFNESFNDPYSMRFVKWSSVEKVFISSEPNWSVTVKFRAKNGFGAYILSQATFYIRKNKVIKTTGLD